MFKNYKKLYKRLVNYVKALGIIREGTIVNKENKDICNYYDGYHDTLNDFYNGCLSKYIEYDKTHNIKIINYKKRYLYIVHYIDYIYQEAMNDTFFHGPDDKYNNGILNCTRDLLEIIIVISQ